MKEYLCVKALLVVEGNLMDACLHQEYGLVLSVSDMVGYDYGKSAKVGGPVIGIDSLHVDS